MNATDAAVAVTLIALVVSFFQWHVNQNYKRLSDQMRDAIDRQAKVEATLEVLEKRLLETRDELHCDYVRDDQLDRLAKEIKADMENVFARLTGVSRSLSEVIGEMRASYRYNGYNGQPGSGDGGNV